MDLAIIGYGFLGRNLLKSLAEKWDTIKAVDPHFRVVGLSNSAGYMCSDQALPPGDILGLDRLEKYPGYTMGGTSLELLDKCSPDIVVELTPTNIVDGEPGLTHIQHSLKMGCHVVTANKGALAHSYWELESKAKRHGVMLLYEASVAGAVPLFSLVRECLQADSITKMLGILNGTTNYILSRMHFEEVGFEVALKEARERGLTERDPSIDIDGYDAACKAVIVANAIMGRRVKLGDVKRRGIGDISAEAVRLAKKSGYAIKLVATITHIVEVAPRLVPINHPLCVHGTHNSIHIESDLAGELTLVGHGAGKQTVSALMNDILTVLKHTPQKNQ
ncbi:MAG: homoserine dehydrogenase [Thermoprotei archaeon]